MKTNWASWADFCAMGGYGLYVWGAFGVTALVLVVELAAIAARRRAVDQLADASDGESGFHNLTAP